MALTHRDVITAAIVLHLAWGQAVHLLPVLGYAPCAFLAVIIFPLLLIVSPVCYSVPEHKRFKVRRNRADLQKDIVTKLDRSFGATDLISRNAIIAAIALYILWGYVSDWVPALRYIPHAFVAGIVMTLIGVGALTLYLVLFTTQGVRGSYDTRPRQKSRMIAFVAPEAWKKKISSLEAPPVYDPAVLYPPSFFISDALNGVVDLILHNYIMSWYSNLCQSSSFPNEVDRALRAALVNLRDRMLGVDFVDVTVQRFLPIITEHFRAFDHAERSVRGPKLDRKVTGSEGLDWAIAGAYREGRLHQAAQSSSDTKSVQHVHLRNTVARLLPDLLPEDVIRCQVVSTLLREILACVVLFPLMQVLSDPDTWNQVVEAYGRSMLRDRRSVRKLRAALDELASPLPRTPTPVSPRKWRRNARANNLRRSSASSTDLRLMAQRPDTGAPQRHSFDISPSRRLFPEDDHEDDPLTLSPHRISVNGVASNQPGGTQDRMVEAMEAALNDIIDDQPPPITARESRFAIQPLGIRSLHNLAFSRGPIGSPRARSLSDERKRAKPNLLSLGLVNMAPSVGVFADDDIFGEEEKLLEEEHADSESVIGEGDSAEGMVDAARGDLDLADAIAVLSSDIERLVIQDSIVDKMIRKAELINNLAELRILNKSKLSLEREIQNKVFQRQRYIVQESDNNLYGRATVEIKSVMVGKAEIGQEYALYVIQVQRKAGQQMPAASCSIARRYREFHDLHQRLRVVYPAVRRLHFPRRRLVLKLQNDFLQKRRRSLEVYLRELLVMPEVCRSRDLQAFLSQHTVSSANESKGEVDERDLVKRIYNSVTDGMSETIGDDIVLDQASATGQTLVSAATDHIIMMPQSVAEDPVSGANGKAEVDAFESRELEPFVKPICDILLEIFNIKRGHSWLRGRTVVVVLHQLLGGVVERKVREYARTLVEEESVIGYINLVKDSIWPAGQGTSGMAKIRTEAEKTKSRKAASVVLATVIPDLAGNIVGKANAQAGSRRIYATLNNPQLTTHLAFTLLDELLQVLFGDLRSR